MNSTQRPYVMLEYLAETKYFDISLFFLMMGSYIVYAMDRIGNSGVPLSTGIY